MAKAPAFQFYANDFMDATSTWEANAVGLYVRCLCKQWTHGSIPADLKILARAVHCDRAELESCWPVVGPKFADQGDGTLKNSRLEEVRERQTEISAKRSDAGKAGAIAKANAREFASANAKQRKVKEKEKVEGEEEVEVKTARKGPDPNVSAVVEHLSAALKVAGIAQSLDGSEQDNRRAAWSLLSKLGKDYPDFDALTSAKTLINAAISDPFHARNSISVRYLLNNCGKIAAAAKERKANPKTQTHGDSEQQLAEALARRARERAATGASI